MDRLERGSEAFNHCDQLRAEAQLLLEESRALRAASRELIEQIKRAADQCRSFTQDRRTDRSG